MLQATSSHGYLSSYEIERDEWVEFEDYLGKALIPLKQTFKVDTEHYSFVIAFSSKVSQYFRGPILLERNLKMRMYSDFRAVGVRAQVVIKQKHRIAGQVDKETVIFDKVVNSMNALEYAYEPNVQADLKVLQEKGIEGLEGAIVAWHKQHGRV